MLGYSSAAKLVALPSGVVVPGAIARGRPVVPLRGKVRFVGDVVSTRGMPLIAPLCEPAAPIIVVIPTYNERENLSSLIAEILALDDAYSVVIVDDNSPDGTGAVADELARRHPDRIVVAHRPGKSGLGPAYVAGFAMALRQSAGLIASMDADHSHAPADLARLVAAAATHDVVLGSRYVDGGRTVGWPIHRRLLSRFGGLYARLVLGVRIVDLTSGFKVFRREVLERIDFDNIHADGYGFSIEITYRAIQDGANVVEVPITFTERRVGTSKISRWIVIEAMIVVWRLRFGLNRRRP